MISWFLIGLGFPQGVIHRLATIVARLLLLQQHVSI